MKIRDKIERITPSAMMVIKVGERVCYAHPADNAAAKELVKMLNSEIFNPEMTDTDGVAKTAPLPWPIPAAERTLTTVPGDIVLLEGNRIAFFYRSETRPATPLANIYGATEEGLKETLGEGGVSVRFSLEWSE